jgi:regulatory protein
MKQLDETEIRHRMAAYCSAAERCKQDVEKKLSVTGLPREACDRILQMLIEEQFIDDARFARCFVSDKLRLNGWGRIRIVCELKRKNISQDIIFEVMSGVDKAAYRDILMQLLLSRKKSLRGKDDRDVYGKLQSYAFGRGFESEEIENCLLLLFDGQKYDEAAE